MLSNEIHMTTAIATWLATALLHTENKDRESFQAKEIFQKIRDEDLIQTHDNTLMAHITVHCVANTKPQPNTHRKLFRVSPGRYRLYKDGDDYHSLREGGQSVPVVDEVPAKYRNLIDWYHSEYNAGTKPKKPKPTSLLFTSLEKDGVIKLPHNILSKLQLEEGDYVAFVDNSSGDITLRKLKMQVE